MALKQEGVHFVLCPKQGNKIEGIVLNRACILGLFCAIQGQGFKPSGAHLYSNIGRVPPCLPPCPPRDSSLLTFCLHSVNKVIYTRKNNTRLT